MKRNILLVDDEPNVLASIQRVLSEEPYQILTAASGPEALSILEATPVDVVVADHDMPGMNGTDFLSHVYMNHPCTVRIMLTGKATVDIAIDAINEGAVSRLLTKPCDPSELALAIHQALIQKDLQDEARKLDSQKNKQICALDDLERKSPGITRVDRDRHGAIEIDDLPAEQKLHAHNPNEV